jgi:hypothetical protein
MLEEQGYMEYGHRYILEELDNIERNMYIYVGEA